MPVPEFIVELRKKVGHAPLWLSGVSVVIRGDDNRLLLTRRVDNRQWALVSGIVDPGEEPASAAVRETKEETGIDIEVMRLSSVDVTEPIVHPNGDLAQYLNVCFTARATGGDAHVADDENLEVAWFEPDDLPPDLMKTSRMRIGKALQDKPEAWFRR